jgi:hypothetical protein
MYQIANEDANNRRELFNRTARKMGVARDGGVLQQGSGGDGDHVHDRLVVDHRSDRRYAGQVTLDVCLNVALSEEGSLGGCGVADAGQTSSESFKRSVVRRGLYIRVTS